jgi:trigger factor
VDSIEIPLPEKYVEHELEHQREAFDSQLAQAGLSMTDYLESSEQTQEEFDAEQLKQAEHGVKVGFVLDALARGEELTVSQAELSYFVADQAQRLGMAPEYFARQLSESGQLGLAVTEVLRTKAAALLAERAKVTDEDGNPVDVKAEVEALNADVDSMLAAQAASAVAAQATAGSGAPASEAAADVAVVADDEATETDDADDDNIADDADDEA